MYKLPYYTEPDENKVLDFMESNHFALLIGVNNNLAYSTHVPLEIKKENGKITLTGHMMKETDHYKAFERNEEILVIFTGPHCYISAAWYTQKR